jgi:hypothetical protein
MGVNKGGRGPSLIGGASLAFTWRGRRAEKDHEKVRIVIVPVKIQSKPLLNRVLYGGCLYMFL